MVKGKASADTGSQSVGTKDSFLIRMGDSFTRASQKYMPDPTIFAIVLTILAFLLSMIVTKVTPLQSLTNWYRGLWELLTFAMQMTLCVITGAVMADAPIIKRGIGVISKMPKTGSQAAFTVALVSVLLSYVQFGLSPVVSALLAKNIAISMRKKEIPFEYGLLAACSYVGYMTWCCGLSSSVGLTIATPGHFLEGDMGVIPMSRFLFNPMNIFMVISFVVFVPIIAYLLHPKGSHVNEIPDYALPSLVEDERPVQAESVSIDSVGERLNNSRILCGIVGSMGILYVIWNFIQKGFALDLNIINTIFLFSGLLLHGNVARYVASFSRSTVSASGIIFQFPLYAGIMGIVRFSGLANILAAGIVSISTPFTFYFWTFISASIVNMFVPSGGGQWAVQGPIAVESARLMGADVLKTALAVAHGNSWTNMAQPFWALALLGIMGLKAKDVMGYSAAIMLASGFIFIIAALFLPV